VLLAGAVYERIKTNKDKLAGISVDMWTMNVGGQVVFLTLC